MIKKVSYVRAPGDLELMATFTLDGETVRAEYASADFQRQVDNGMIWAHDLGELTPADGKNFLDALERTYATSSRVVVETE